MKRSRLGAIAIAVVLAASAAMLSACGDDGASASTGASVRLATGVDPSYTAVYVAQEKGFFEDHGVDVEVLKLEGGPAMAQAVIAGQARDGDPVRRHLGDHDGDRS